MECPGTNKILIFTQRQITKINRTTSDTPTWNLHIWYAFWYILHHLCRRRQMFLWFQDLYQKRNHPPLQPLLPVWPWNEHWHRKNTSKNECIFFAPTGFFNTCTSPTTGPNNSTLALQEKKLETETHKWRKIIYQVQRNSNHQSERRIFYLHH